MFNIFQARTIDYDPNFLNFDWAAVERLSGPDFEKYFKQTYGVDYAVKPGGKTVKVDDSQFTIVQPDLSQAAKHCLKSEFM